MIAELAHQLAAINIRTANTNTNDVTVIPIGIIAALVLLVASRQVNEIVIDTISISAAAIATYIDHGAAALALVTILTFRAVFILGLIRNFLQSKKIR